MCFDGFDEALKLDSCKILIPCSEESAMTGRMHVVAIALSAVNTHTSKAAYTRSGRREDREIKSVTRLYEC